MVDRRGEIRQSHQINEPDRVVLSELRDTSCGTPLRRVLPSRFWLIVSLFHHIQRDHWQIR